MSSLIRAAQYVRMSTDHQRYSIDNQLAALGLYAETHGYRIVRTYADEGRSGLDLGGRPGLQRLLADAGVPGRPFDALLVYDVSRWGRFQDIDEGAYYEHLCKRAGMRVIYCGEPFENDGSALGNVIKALKRIMAAEYSRELSDRTAAGQYRMVLRGFHRGGKPGIGLARVLLDENGAVRTRLAPGQEKHLKTDRVILDRGPDDEVRLVVRIFEMFVREGLNENKIAAVLNAEGLRTAAGAIWRERRIRQILESERNIGTKVHGRIGGRLRGPIKLNPPEMWLTLPEAFPAIVPRDLYDGARAIFERRRRRKTDEDLLDDLKALWTKKGKLTTDLIKAERGIASCHTYYFRFGSLSAAYELIGYPRRRVCCGPPPDLNAMVEHLRTLLTTHGKLSRDLVNASTGPSVRLYEWYFGSLGYAYRLAGYKAKGGKSVEPSDWRRQFVERSMANTAAA